MVRAPKDVITFEGPKKKKSRKRGKKKPLPTNKPNYAKEDFEEVLTVVKSPPKPKHNNSPKKSGSAAFIAVSIFFFMLSTNIFLFYIATIRFPETFEKFLELIELESFRLKVSDFVQNFITSPDLFN